MAENSSARCGGKYRDGVLRGHDLALPELLHFADVYLNGVEVPERLAAEYNRGYPESFERHGGDYDADALELRGAREQLRQLVARAADEYVRRARKLAYRLKRAALVQRHVEEAELLHVLGLERVRLVVYLDGVDFALAAYHRGGDGNRARARADVPEHGIFRQPELRKDGGANLLARHRHLRADEILVARQKLRLGRRIRVDGEHYRQAVEIHARELGGPPARYSLVRVAEPLADRDVDMVEAARGEQRAEPARVLVRAAEEGRRPVPVDRRQHLRFADAAPVAREYPNALPGLRGFGAEALQ